MIKGLIAGLLSALLLAGATVHAQTVYKSVDDEADPIKPRNEVSAKSRKLLMLERNMIGIECVWQTRKKALEKLLERVHQRVVDRLGLDMQKVSTKPA